MGITEAAFKRASEEVKRISNTNDQGSKMRAGRLSADEYEKLRSACNIIKNKAKKC